MEFSTYSIVFLLIGYLFLTYLSIDIFKYFDRLKEVFTDTSNYLFNISYNILGRNKKHIDYIKNENQKSFKFYLQVSKIPSFQKTHLEGK